MPKKNKKNLNIGNQVFVENLEVSYFQQVKFLNPSLKSDSNVWKPKLKIDSKAFSSRKKGRNVLWTAAAAIR